MFHADGLHTARRTDGEVDRETEGLEEADSARAPFNTRRKLNNCAKGSHIRIVAVRLSTT